MTYVQAGGGLNSAEYGHLGGVGRRDDLAGHSSFPVEA